jgi:ribonuclease HIII
VAQKTVVVQMSPARARDLERRLTERAFTFRSAPHALLSAKGEGVVATLYSSGKLVVQGDDPESFLLSFVDGAVPQPRKEAAATGASEPQLTGETVVGSDESGKGDYFGPLVVAAVRLDPELESKLAGGEVRDCKQMTDEAVLRVGAALRTHVPNAVVRLDPPDYNAEHARVKNLNPLLASLHAKAIAQLASPGMHVVVDQFGNASLLENALRGLDVRLEQRPRAEEILVVAAASVLARAEFLVAMRELSEAWGLNLAKGAGHPVDQAARRFVALHGADKLGAVAKLHFKNTQKIGLGGAR